MIFAYFSHILFYRVERPSAKLKCETRKFT